MNNLAHTTSAARMLSYAAPAAVAGAPADDSPSAAAQSHVEAAQQTGTAPGPMGAWFLYAAGVVVGLVVAVGSLLTVLIGQGPSSVAIGAAALLAAGFAACAAVTPRLRRRAPAALAAGSGAGLMAGGLLLGAVAIMIVLS